MDSSIHRRQFLKMGTAGLGLAMAAPNLARGAENDRPVRIGLIGSGGRGCGLMGILLTMKGIRVPAVCDISPSRIQVAQGMVESAGQPQPEGYLGEEAYLKLLERDDLDAVIIATPWDWHARQAVDAMKAGKYPGVEVPAAVSVQECWDLVNTSEDTGVPCMMLENWSFRRDNLAVLNMIRQGLFGDMVHCHCAHSHDCVGHWFWDRQGNERWGARFLMKYNRDQYPTHSVGPVLSWLDINCGDAFATLTSTATGSFGINAHFARTFGPDDPRATRKYAQGDIVTSVVRTQKGKSIVINYDMQLPRPYDNRWEVSGTLGIYNEQREAIYLLGRSPQRHHWEPFAPYQDEFDHHWWKTSGPDVARQGHGGTDYLELRGFVQAVRDRTQTPIDVYDSATMSSIIGLSEQSIASGSAPVECPDFTRGKWKTRKPTFAV
jgi:predicted dehydrogenase